MRDLLLRRTFWVMVVAVLVPFGWLVLLVRLVVRAAGKRDRELGREPGVALPPGVRLRRAAHRRRHDGPAPRGAADPLHRPAAGRSGESAATSARLSVRGAAAAGGWDAPDRRAERRLDRGRLHLHDLPLI